MSRYTLRRPLTLEEKNLFPGYSDIASHLLFHRGLYDVASARAFITPDYLSGVHDPFLLKDADKAAQKIIDTISTKGKIAVFSDYDCDGIPGAAMFHDFFSRINYKNFVVYIPHRHNEGFGLNEGAIDELVAQEVKLVITIDCGISDKEVVAYANKKGLEVIITDHHEPPPDELGGIPDAYAVIDPKRADCQYPDKNLCGTGVGFKLIQAILAKERFGLKEGMEKWLLDLVGIATLSDMVPLVGENRVYAHYGLHVLRKTQRKGLAKLFSKLRMNQAHLTEDDIAFMITPRINAASRMGVPMDAFNLLTASTDEQADTCATHLDAINNERKGVVAALVKEVKKLVRDRYSDNIPTVIVLGNPEWRPSLLGLAANSCAEEFNRPVFLWGRDGSGHLKGSCRSEGISNVVNIMRAVPEGVFSECGGHKHSGGFGVNKDQIHHLSEILNEAADKLQVASNKLQVEGSQSQVGNELVESEDLIDYELSLDDVTGNLHGDVDKLAPFGVGNRKPVFIFKNIKPISVRTFGKGNEHVELVFPQKNGRKVSAISFFGSTSPWATPLEASRSLDLVASIEKSMFRNRPEIRLRVVDVIYS